MKTQSYHVCLCADLMRAYYSGGWKTGGQSRSQVGKIYMEGLDWETWDLGLDWENDNYQFSIQDLLPQYDDAVVVDNQDYQGDQPVKVRQASADTPLTKQKKRWGYMYF